MVVRAAPIERLPRPIRSCRRISRQIQNATALPLPQPAPKATLSRGLSIAVTEFAATSPFPAEPRRYQSGNPQVVPRRRRGLLRLVHLGNQKVHPAGVVRLVAPFIRQAATRSAERNFGLGLCESGIRPLAASASGRTGALSRPRIRLSSTNTRAHGLT